MAIRFRDAELLATFFDALARPPTNPTGCLIDCDQWGPRELRPTNTGGRPSTPGRKRTRKPPSP